MYDARTGKSTALAGPIAAAASVGIAIQTERGERGMAAGKKKKKKRRKKEAVQSEAVNQEEQDNLVVADREAPKLEGVDDIDVVVDSVDFVDESTSSQR